jgi:hypothetical protein
MRKLVSTGEKKTVCHSLYYAINWIRELVCFDFSDLIDSMLPRRSASSQLFLTEASQYSLAFYK